MAALFWLAILGLIIYLLVRDYGPKTDVQSPEARLAERNAEWARFIDGYRNVAKTKSEKALIERMLADIKSQRLVAAAWEMPDDREHDLGDLEELPSMNAATAAAAFEPDPLPLPPPKVDLDNISLLLYFGAFLFVASVGLFIAFGGANGVIRTFAVLAVTGILYASGMWLFHNKPKLKQAGVAFSGIGMTIAPLSGVAAFNYLFNQTNGPVVWFATSLLCLGMYAHALWVFRQPLVSYILIFTFLSLFESGVSIISAPVYYFGWAMALVGIILSIASRIKGFWPEVQQSSRASSQLILPLSLLASLSLLPEHGAGQLGVSLLFAAAYYGLETLNTKDTEQQANAVAAHAATLLSLICLSYAASYSWKVVAVTVLALNIIQMACVLVLPQKSILWRNFASVMLVAALAGVMFAVASPGILLAETSALVAIGLVVWRRQQRLEGYVLSIFAWMAIPFLFGQYFLISKLEAAPQAILLFSALLVQYCVYTWYSLTGKDALWRAAAQQAYILSLVIVLAASFFASAWVCFALALGIVATTLVLAEYEHDSDWAAISGIVAIAPIIRTSQVPGALVAATVTALCLNIVFALRYRKELNRWLCTGLWLFLPISLGAGLIGQWTTATYAWTYLLVMLALVFSRTIARGSIMISSKVPLASYGKTASTSYVAGYWLAGILAVVISLASADSQLHTTGILTIVTAIVYYLGRWVERRADIMAMLPLLLQAILWSAMRPVIAADSMPLYLLCSTSLAAASYFVTLIDSANQGQRENIARFREGALAALFVAPAAFVVVPYTLWPMPFGLMVAGLVVYYHIRNTSQANREMAGALIVAALMWFLWFAGIRETQAYTHVIVALLGFYAYWRATRNESEQSDQYLMFMLAVATIPLSLQAIGGQAGGLYGWWLLLEQIAFMLIGMAIRKRVVTLWGLYVAVGAVLYQLRNLGWAALTVLAVFLIGIAIYQLQRHEKS